MKGTNLQHHFDIRGLEEPHDFDRDVLAVKPAFPDVTKPPGRHLFSYFL
jgi:hypothetical protein